MNKVSTDRVRQYRQRQRDASRKLVRFYLDADSCDKLAQLASSGQPHAALAEALLTAAVANAWSIREAQQQTDRKGREGRSQAVPESIAASASARPAHCLGRRRNFAALNDATGKVPGL
jgi:hypothetical protein